MKTFVIFSLIVSIFLFSFSFCFAQEIEPIRVRDGLITSYREADLNTDNSTDYNRSPIDVISATIRVALTVIPGVYLIYALYAGILWITSYGEQQKVKRARDILITGSIGFALVYMAGMIVYEILDLIITNSYV